MSKVAFIAFSDLHYSDMKAYTETRRIEYCDKVLEKVSEEAKKYNVPVLFCGDWYHNPNSLSNELINRSHKIYKETFETLGIPVIGIAGNHDQAQNDTINHRGPNYLDNLEQIFSTFTQLYNDYVDIKGYRILGIPYFKNDEGFLQSLKNLKVNKDKKNILLIHRDLPGAIDSNGVEMGMCEDITRETLNKTFSKYDLVLSGHIHKPQQLGRNTYMLGSPYHQRISDSGCNMGIYRIYNNLKLEFVELDLPQFKYIKEGEEKPDNYHFYIEKPKIKEQEEITTKFHSKEKPTTLGKRYLKAIGEKSKSKKRILTQYLRMI